jgi:hypothetical protein
MNVAALFAKTQRLGNPRSNLGNDLALPRVLTAQNQNELSKSHGFR